MIYSGAQKNAGPSGVTLVVARKSFLDTAKPNLSTILSYKTHRDSNSLYNTPPVFSIFVVGLVLKWIESQGGLTGIGEINRNKAAFSIALSMITRRFTNFL